MVLRKSRFPFFSVLLFRMIYKVKEEEEEQEEEEEEVVSVFLFPFRPLIGREMYGIYN